MPVTARRLVSLLLAAALVAGHGVAPVTVSAAVPAPGASIVVTSAGDTVADDGVCTLREAINAANDNTASGDSAGTPCAAGTDGEDVITFDAAVTTVAPPGPLPEIITLMRIDGGSTVTIDGGTTVRPFIAQGSSTLTLANLTLTGGSGSSGGIVFNQGTATLDNVTLSSNAATLGGGAVSSDGSLTVIGCTFSSNTSAGAGGAIEGTGTLDITDSTFSSNAATTSGGAISFSGTVTITGSTFSNNAALDWGGAIVLGTGSVTATSTVFDGNTATNNGGAVGSDGPATYAFTGGEIKNGQATYGAGLYAGSNVSATISGVTFTGNDADQQGGALFVSGTATITDAAFNGNTAAAGGAAATEGVYDDTGSTYDFNTVSGVGGGAVVTSGTTTLDGVSITNGSANAGFGGGVYVVGGTTDLTAADVTGNAANNGGGLAGTDGTLTVARTTIGSNIATSGGGGLSLSSTAAGTVVRSLFTGNSAGVGGGISIASPVTFTLADSTVYDNHSDAQGGGIQAGGTTTLLNVTVTGNQGGGVSAEGTVTINNSILVGNAPAELTGSVTGDSGDNLLGGTATAIFAVGTPEVLGQGPALIRLKNSATNPALDTADSTTCAAAPVGGIDQRGYPRPALCDMGAHELDKGLPTVSTPQLRLRSSVGLDGSRLRVRVSWTGSDNAGGSGLAGYTVAMSTSGGPFLKLDADLITTTFRDVSLSSGKTYRFQVRAVDNDLNVRDAFSTTVTAGLLQQSSSAFTYRGTWKTSTSTSFSGGSAKYATASGASFSVTRTARGYAFVTTKGPKRGKAKIYVNGTLVKTVDLYAPTTTTFRVQAWTAWYSTAKARTIKVVVVGTSGRPRVDADAIATLK